MKKSEMTPEETQEMISKVCKSLESFVISKNRLYGNSALSAIGVFSKMDVAEQINVRLDDKLMRVRNSKEDRKNDHVDLLGYLILKCVQKGWVDFSDMID